MELDPRPWEALPRELAVALRPQLAPLADEIVEAIRVSVPAYARPMAGRFGEGVRTGVEEALRRFVALIEGEPVPEDPGREMYRALGRGEQRAGRTLDALQAAYRLGAREARRRGWTPPPCSAWARRSSPTSTSWPRSPSRATRRPRPRARASASGAGADSSHCWPRGAPTPTRRPGPPARRTGRCRASWPRWRSGAPAPTAAHGRWPTRGGSPPAWGPRRCSAWSGTLRACCWPIQAARAESASCAPRWPARRRASDRR